VRVNGGWVRDKIMGLESDDIDVSLDDLSGEDFAKLVTEQLT
jgi:tRNA nucleotidyltransferase (CCA-adding enzyme)